MKLAKVLLSVRKNFRTLAATDQSDLNNKGNRTLYIETLVALRNSAKRLGVLEIWERVQYSFFFHFHDKKKMMKEMKSALTQKETVEKKEKKGK
jgi:hypothetical protein